VVKRKRYAKQFVNIRTFDLRPCLHHYTVDEKKNKLPQLLFDHGGQVTLQRFTIPVITSSLQCVMTRLILFEIICERKKDNYLLMR